MACHWFYRWLRSGEGLLPDRWTARLLLPHAAGCAECRAHRERRQRLEARLRQTLREDAAAYVAPAPLRRADSVSPRRRPRALVPAVALALAAAAGLTLLLREGRSHPAVQVRRGTGGTSDPVIGLRLPRRAPEPLVARRAPAPHAPPRIAAARLAAPEVLRQSFRSFPAPAAHGHSPAAAGNRVPDSQLASRPAVVDDMTFLNPDAQSVIREWARMPPSEWDRIEAAVRRTVLVRDDFVQIPFPRIAATSERPIAEAVEQYKKEAAIIDPRLSREVTLAVKAMAFSDLCDRLRADTGIEISAGRSVADDKVTIFCEKRPVREIMRRINDLFGFTWLRSGPEGQYRYELVQDLQTQLTEEELRNRDRHAALVALDQEMAAYRPDLELTRDERERRLAGADEAEKERLSALQSGAAAAAAQLYLGLTAAQRLRLAAGETIEFRCDAGPPDQRLPVAWREKLMSAGPAGAPPPDNPSAMPSLALHVDRSELGQLSLKYRLTVPSGGDFISFEPGQPLAVGQSPSVARPPNALLNRTLRTEPLFQRHVSIAPQPSCPRFAAGSGRSHPEARPDGSAPGEFGPETPHVTTADVWEAVHQKTGQAIIADAYSHIYPVDRVRVDQLPLFDALNQVGEALGVRWRKEGDFLLCRSTRYFWDRLKEVPNRYLLRWQQDSRANGGLPLDDFLQMAGLSDAQLDSGVVGQVVEHCWGLEEWGIAGSGPARGGNVAVFNLRPFARFVASLSPEQRRRAHAPEWLAAEALTPAQQEALARALQPQGIPPQYLTGLRLQFNYVPAGGYVCGPWTNSPRREAALSEPVLVGSTRAAVEAAARRLQPDAGPDDIQKSRGIFAFACKLANGRSWDIGWPLVVR